MRLQTQKNSILKDYDFVRRSIMNENNKSIHIDPLKRLLDIFKKRHEGVKHEYEKDLTDMWFKLIHKFDNYEK